MIIHYPCETQLEFNALGRKRTEKDIPGKLLQKKIGVAQVISEKADFKAKKITRNKEEFCLCNETLSQNIIFKKTGNVAQW